MRMGAEALEQQHKKDGASSCIVSLHEPELVSPSRPTAQPGSSYFLSNLDQNLAVVMQTVYFFKPPADDAAAKAKSPVQVIRDALSELLVWYYPLAGRFAISKEGRLEIQCTGEGALFVEAEAEKSLAEFERESNLGENLDANLAQFVSSGSAAPKSILDVPPLVVQLTRFKCAGFVLGLSINHAVMDGIGAMEFVNCWTEIARGLPLSVTPKLDRSILKARQPLQVEYSHPEFLNANEGPEQQVIDRSNLVFRSICYDDEWLSSVSRSIVAEGILDKCSRFEAFSAMVWRCRSLALASGPADHKIKLLFAVDIRDKLEPRLPQGYVGNGILLTSACATLRELSGSSFSHTVQLIRNAITKIDSSYIRSVVDFYEQTRLRPSLESTLVITTWSRLAFHTTDFGWGTPCFTAPASLPEPEVALFLPKGRGFNLVLGLPESAMLKFLDLMEHSRQRLLAGAKQQQEQVQQSEADQIKQRSQQQYQQKDSIRFHQQQEYEQQT